MTAPRYEWTVGSGVPERPRLLVIVAIAAAAIAGTAGDDPPAARQRPWRQGSGRSDLAARLADPPLRARWAVRLVPQAGEPLRAPDDRRGARARCCRPSPRPTPTSSPRSAGRSTSLPFAVFMHVFLAFPTGALRSRGERMLVGAALRGGAAQRRRPDARRLRPGQRDRGRSTLRDSPRTSCGSSSS